ncbi:mannosyltransferase putative-domain-containing protein [Entophlyctis helioformis]|nr:mannosyltransferase putative-domain-containing protein [Entophlyctis helioformis]
MKWLAAYMGRATPRWLLLLAALTIPALSTLVLLDIDASSLARGHLVNQHQSRDPASSTAHAHASDGSSSALLTSGPYLSELSDLAFLELAKQPNGSNWTLLGHHLRLFNATYAAQTWVSSVGLVAASRVSRLSLSRMELILTSFRLLERSLFPWLGKQPVQPGMADRTSARRRRGGRDGRDGQDDLGGLGGLSVEHVRAAAGRGIVMTTGTKYATMAKFAIFALRHAGSVLPVEIVYCGESDMAADARSMFDQLANVTLVDMSSMMGGDCSNGWQLKPFAVLASSFRQVILMDADTIFMQPPETLFDNPSFIQTGALLFRDRTLPYGTWRGGPGINEMLDEVAAPFKGDLLFNASRVVAKQSAVEIDSGVVVWDKDRAMPAILAACLMNSRPYRDSLYARSYGDKESFWLAHEALRMPFALGRGNGGSIGAYNSSTNQVCGHLYHPDDAMRPLWLNGGLGRPRVPITLGTTGKSRSSTSTSGHYVLSLTHWATEESGNATWSSQTEPFCLKVNGGVVRGSLDEGELAMSQFLEETWRFMFVGGGPATE